MALLVGREVQMIPVESWALHSIDLIQLLVKDDVMI